jgi:glycosyltransferase involved in cell wall biosynthesis
MLTKKKDRGFSPVPMGESYLKGMKAKIAFLSTFNQACGVATHTGYTLEGIQSAERKHRIEGLKFIVLAEDSQQIKGEDQPWVYRSWSCNKDDFSRVKMLLSSHGIKILHVQYHQVIYKGTDILGLAKYCSGAGIQLYVTFHSFEGESAACTNLVNLSTYSFVHQEQSKVRFVAYGADSSKIRVVPHGVFNDRPSVTREMARTQLGLQQDLKLISSFGFLGANKGVFEIIAELPAVFKRHLEARFIFLGTPYHGSPASVDYGNRCKQLAAKLDISDRVIFADAFLPEDVISSYLSASDVVIMSYHLSMNEASGAGSFALAHLRPLITSPAQAFRHMIGCTLQLSTSISIAAAICLVLESPYLADYLVKNAKEYMDHASYAVLGTILLESYGIIGQSSDSICAESLRAIDRHILNCKKNIRKL